MKYHLEYRTIGGQWVRVASYPSLEAATEAHNRSAVIHKRIVKEA
jgi:hypothetical protein